MNTQSPHAGGESIHLVRGKGGQVEVWGPVDGFAGQVLRRAGFEFQPSLRGHWIRLPFDHGRDWENEHAAWAAEMLTAARYPVRLDPDLHQQPGSSSASRRRPVMASQTRPTGQRAR